MLPKTVLMKMKIIVIVIIIIFIQPYVPELKKKCNLSNDIYDYHFVSQGKTKVGNFENMGENYHKFENMGKHFVLPF